jgi:NADH-quinone oxidoreductase subunit N
MAILYPDALIDSTLWVFMLGYGTSVVALLTISMILNDESDEIASFKGIGYRKPLIGLVAIAALLSTSGIPPMTGFFGKLMLFSSVWSYYPWLIVFALINSAIGVFIYLRLIMTIMSKETDSEAKEIAVSPLQTIVLVISLLLLVGGWLMLLCWK